MRLSKEERRLKAIKTELQKENEQLMKAYSDKHKEARTLIEQRKKKGLFEITLELKYIQFNINDNKEIINEIQTYFNELRK